MATSKVYSYQNLVENVFGYYQSNFNFDLALDETKDSAKIIVLSMSDTILTPNTIVRLEGIDFWWCVKKDTRQRVMSDNGFLYEHTFELQGAFEILNSRDLISCGFNTDHYSVASSLHRLINLSDFELPVDINYNGIIDKNKTVDYIKTYENYTLASAIKEFLSGYNCIPKMSFAVESGAITSAVITIYSKSGLYETPLDFDVFNETNAIDTIDRESYATRVLSNIQNCVGRNPIKYPRVGATYLIGENGYITYENAKAGQTKLLLPSKAYAVNSITIFGFLKLSVGNGYVYASPDDLSRNGETCKNDIISMLSDQTIIDYIEEHWDSIFSVIKSYGSKTIRNGGYYDAIENEPYGNYVYIGNNRIDGHNCRLYLNNERYAYNNDGSFEWVISWKQGSNEIKGLGEALEHAQSGGAQYDSSWFINESATIFESGGNVIISVPQNACSLSLIDETVSATPNIPHILVKVSYIPMTDIKFKTDNNILGNETKLYNQNGKLVDSYAVSKLVNSYCKSIRERELTRFGIYYKFSDIPKLGARVGDYVINNISYDVYDNDDNGFEYHCQFSLNLYSICKSTMINANTNIRDYDCPQSNNVRRTQTYRDFVELSYTQGANDTTYLSKSKLFHIDLDHIGLNDNLVFVMRATDDEFDNEGDNHSHDYYYHLDHVSYDLCKQKKIIVDFGDNNIVGYGNAHTYKPFSLGNIFDMGKAVTIPISYVNTYGEVEGLELLACEETVAEENFGGIYISKSVAIPSTIYDDFHATRILTIEEPSYEKDGLEVPVFEYSCEINGDDNIEVADNFFEYEEDIDEFVAVKFDCPITNENQGLAIDGTKYSISILQRTTYLELVFSGTLPSSKGHWGIYAKKGNGYRFLFALNNYNQEWDNYMLKVYTNFYRLK